MKKRSVRASKQANATGSLRKRKLEPRSYISPRSTTRTVARRYGLLGDITASVLWVHLGLFARTACIGGVVFPIDQRHEALLHPLYPVGRKVGGRHHLTNPLTT